MGDGDREKGKERERATEMDDKAEIRREREVDERRPAEVVSMDPVVVCTRIYCAVTTLRFERQREGEAAAKRVEESFTQQA